MPDTGAQSMLGGYALGRHIDWSRSDAKFCYDWVVEVRYTPCRHTASRQPRVQAQAYDLLD
jgi:hypothetical protein|eukprot:COSAG01_NODE_4915_length_4629_cov_17.202649_2_plen_61_part_00